MQDTFSNVGILFIDEKNMVGQKTFTMVTKRLQEARPRYKDKSFGNLSVVLLGGGGLQAAVTNLRFSAIQGKCRSSQRIQHSFTTPYTRFLTRPSPSPNLYGNKEQTK